MEGRTMYRCVETNKRSVPNPFVTDYNRLLAAYNSKLEETATGQDVVSTLGNLHDLSLLEQLTNSSTSTRAIDLQTVHDRVNRNELHLPIIRKPNNRPSALQQPTCRNQPARSKPCYRQFHAPFPYSTSKQINRF